MVSGTRHFGLEVEKRAEHSSTNGDCESMKLAVASAKASIRLPKLPRTTIRDLSARSMSPSSTPTRRRHPSERGSLDLP